MRTPTAVTLWAAGIEGSLRALDPLVGAVHQHPVEDQEPVLFALIAHAVNHQLAMYSLALDGYYMESLGLVRACVERWLAWLYVTNFPNHAIRFLRPEAGDSPEWGEMLASAVIPPLLQVTEQFCMRYGVEPAEPGAAEAYAAQLKTWM